MTRTFLTAALLFGLPAVLMAQTPKLVRLGSKRDIKTEETIPTAFRGTPLLQGFDFDFGIRDNHIRQIGLLHGRNRFTAMFADKKNDSPNDFFAWSADFVTLDHPGIVLGEASGKLERGRAVQLLNYPQGKFAFVLRGFKINYGSVLSSVDHHVDEVGVWQSGGQLHVVLNDKNNDDVFTYRVQYAFVPSSLIESFTTTRGNAAGEEAKRRSKVGIPVLSGFHFDYKSKDHHLQSIGVDQKPGNLKVTYHDKNRDDKFTWTINSVSLKKGSAEPLVGNPILTGKLNVTRATTRATRRGK